MEGRSPGARTLYRYRFAAAEFDEGRFELSVAGLTVEIQRRPLEVLQALLARPNEVVTRQELLDSVWNGRPSVEHVVANAINKLRSALGDTQGEVIVTIPRVGYRLAASVDRVVVGKALDSRLELHQGDRVPGRVNFELQRLLSASGAEVWLAQHTKTRERRIYKFSAESERLGALKREATVFRLLSESCGTRADLVRVLDWNFASPPFFLECEYGGPNLNDWAASGELSRLGRAQRIELFLQIAEAVAAAHAVGVLHKDLKPANVLISEFPGAQLPWQIKLTDFGSSRLLEPERLASIGITQLGFTMTAALNADTSGTPLYLAPELIALQPATVKTDLYALGMMLYQLCVGDLRKTLVPGWQRDIEDDLLRGDIAAATDGNPEHRLNSVAELSERLRRLGERREQHVQRQANDAAAAALQQSLQRSRMRRPWIVATFVALMLGLLTSLAFFYRSSRSEQELTRQKAVVEHLNQFLTEDLIGAANPSVSGRNDVTVLEAARAAAGRIDTKLAGSSSEVRATLHDALMQAFSGLDDFANAITEGRKALSLYGQLGLQDPWKAAAVELTLARNLIHRSQYDEAGAIFDRVQPTLARADAPLVLQVRWFEGHAYHQRRSGHYAASVADLEQANRLAAALPESAAELKENITLNLAVSRMKLGQRPAAEVLLRELVAQQQQRYGQHHLRTVASKARLGENLLEQRRLDEARSVLADAVAGMDHSLGPRSMRTLTTRAMLGLVLYQQREFEQAAALHSEVLRTITAGRLPMREAGVLIRANLAYDLRRLGKLEAARELTQEALTTARTYSPEHSPLVQNLRYDLANCLLDLGLPRPAQLLLGDLDIRALRDIHRRNWPGWLAYQHGRIHLQTQQLSAALAQFDQALQAVATQGVSADVNDSDLEALTRTMLQKTRQLIEARCGVRAADQGCIKSGAAKTS